ncbi:MAG: TIR domain-containing protein [Proteobacteria bacterium]|nr:TIR domain-containing protein [Pseudomonadota bacterium]
MAESSHAVFLSYASQDAQAAERIAASLRAAGIEVWFDRNELRGGDSWDRKIREQIHDCRLFIPVISTNTEQRDEGYFRREWSLAVDRTRDMAHKRAFLVPVVIDGTPERGASVPDKFHELQWTRLPEGETPPAFVERVQRLLMPEASPAPGRIAVGPQSIPHAPPVRATRAAGRWLLAAVGVAVIGAAAYFTIGKLSSPPVAAGAATAKAGSFTPPPHSVAVLPFVNMSGDKEQEYFSEGLAEELLNSLAQIRGLQVAARTSSFSFKEHTDIGTVARALNVAAVLEGSVRRSTSTVRVTAQLINAATGFHMWSKTYDRDLGDVLKLQTEIATAVAEALKVTLLGDVAARIELGGTRIPGAFDAYLRASKGFQGYASAADLQAAIESYSEAIRQDPSYAIALAARSVALAAYARNYGTGTVVHDYRARSQADAQAAIALTPELAEAHVALGTVLRDSLEFTRAAQEFQRAVELASGNAQVLADYGSFNVEMGHTEAGLAAIRQALVLDPLSPEAHSTLGYALVEAHQHAEAIKVLTEARARVANPAFLNAWLAFAYYASGQYENARVACEAGDESNRAICLCLIYEKLGRHAEAEQALADLRAKYADDAAVFYAMIYSQWGDKAQALHWLEVAMRSRDAYLIKLKTNGYFNPIRHEPRFQAIERELKFPD